MTDRALGEALGRSFVVTTIGEEGKKVAKEMIEGNEGAFERNLAAVGWMDEAARAASREKLRKIDNKIGYPEKWRDYSTVKIGRASLLANLAEAALFETRRDLAKIGKPVDRNEWQMTPPTVNAYYNPSMNEMVFPAGIMQAPFFKTDSPVVTNHGGLGMVMIGLACYGSNAIMSSYTLGMILRFFYGMAMGCVGPPVTESIRGAL